MLDSKINVCLRDFWFSFIVDGLITDGEVLIVVFDTDTCEHVFRGVPGRKSWEEFLTSKYQFYHVDSIRWDAYDKPYLCIHINQQGGKN